MAVIGKANFLGRIRMTIQEGIGRLQPAIYQLVKRKAYQKGRVRPIYG